MFRIFLILFLFISVPVMAALPEADKIGIVASDGDDILAEYTETCRNDKGKFIKCTGKEVGKVVRRCRDNQNGRFIKCPKKVNE